MSQISENQSVVVTSDPPTPVMVGNVEIPAAIAPQLERSRVYGAFAAKALSEALEVKRACHGNGNSTADQRDAYSHLVKATEKAIDRTIGAAHSEIAMQLGLIPRKVK